MGKTPPPYPREYREEAVRRVRGSGKSIGQIAKDLGIADQSLLSARVTLPDAAPPRDAQTCQSGGDQHQAAGLRHG